MPMRKFRLFFIILLGALTANAQNNFHPDLIMGTGPDTVNRKMVTELSSIQTVKNTFLVATMFGGNGQGQSYFTIYRSTNNGAKWDSVFTRKGSTVFLSNPDPVLGTDSIGNVYCAVMAIPVGGYGEYDIWMYRSTNDGLTWSLASKPDSSGTFDDFPAVLGSGNGHVFLSFTRGTPIVFMRSFDGGLTWQDTLVFQKKKQGSYQVGEMCSSLGWTVNHNLCISYCGSNSHLVYFSKSKDEGLTWKPFDTIAFAGGSSITKLVTSKSFSHMGIIAHQPHVLTDLFYLTSLDTGNTWTSQSIAKWSAYCEGVIDNGGNVNLVYNKWDSVAHSLAYIYSTDKGKTFSSETTLLSWPNPTVTRSNGEYQSLKLGNDGLLHLTYEDWHDSSAARHLVFAPLVTDIYKYDPATHAPRIYPNPVHDELTFESDETNRNATFEIIDLQGKILIGGKVEIPKTSLTISHLPSGIYLLRVYSGNLTYVQKVIKE